MGKVEDHGQSLFPVIIGIAVGVVTNAALWMLDVTGWHLWVTLPLIGGLAGHVLDLHRIKQMDHKNSTANATAMCQSSARGAGPTREAAEPEPHQETWSYRLEKQLAERSAALESLLENVAQAHDELIAAPSDRIEPEVQRELDSRAESIARTRQNLDELLQAATVGSGLIRLFRTEQLKVAPLVGQLRSRLRAFVEGKDVRVSVFNSSEAPRTIQTDRLLFDRVTDALLTSAAERTQYGSIVVELAGKPDYLSIKVSDSGHEIPPENLQRIARPDGSIASGCDDNDDDNVLLDSLFGVKTLLTQIGGELEVLSGPGRGTTFQASFPIVSKTKRRRRPGRPRPKQTAWADKTGKILQFRRNEAQ